MTFGPPFAAGMLSASAMKYVSIYLEDSLEDVKRWSGSGRDTANIVVADDAEYCGTNGYYYVIHCTSSANSDGRWPPPPAELCEFNRQWVINEIPATRAVLDELAEETKDIPMPPKPESDQLADSPEYGLHFTVKILSDLENLSFYELQHALYAAWRAFDHTYGDTKNADRSRVLSNYAEYRRRGITHFKDPLI